MEYLIGRRKELKNLLELKESDKSEFVAIYGRRRVGKTFLVREAFGRNFAFEHTGVANLGMRDQLSRFHAALIKHSDQKAPIPLPRTWFEAFDALTGLLERLPEGDKKVIFIDELPWLDTRNSKFLSALEYFWNAWASARRDVLLIVCGSAAAWMVKNLLHNRGGLHNRVTERIRLQPFDLADTELFLKKKKAVYDRYQIIQLYMVFGGIPFYLSKIKPSKSVLQNINTLCFGADAPFRYEYEDLYRSLFNKADRHLKIISALAQKNKGLNREAIVRLTKLKNGGGLTRILKELEESNFIRKYKAFGKKNKDHLYQLVDLYSLFYLNFIKDSDVENSDFWINFHETPAYSAWSGYAFEMVCLHHVAQIKSALEIGGVQTSFSTWQNADAQVDLVIDRRDRVINLCEMKFSMYPFSIDKKYAEVLRRKVGFFKDDTATDKAILLTLVAPFGLSKNKYSGIVQNELNMDALFGK